MSSTTAENVFSKAVARERRIPFETISGNNGIEAFMALRASAKENGIQDIGIDEINGEINQTREGIGQ